MHYVFRLLPEGRPSKYGLPLWLFINPVTSLQIKLCRDDKLFKPRNSVREALLLRCHTSSIYMVGLLYAFCFRLLPEGRPSKYGLPLWLFIPPPLPVTSLQIKLCRDNKLFKPRNSVRKRYFWDVILQRSIWWAYYTHLSSVCLSVEICRSWDRILAWLCRLLV